MSFVINEFLPKADMYILPTIFCLISIGLLLQQGSWKSACSTALIEKLAQGTIEQERLVHNETAKASYKLFAQSAKKKTRTPNHSQIASLPVSKKKNYLYKSRRSLEHTAPQQRALNLQPLLASDHPTEHPLYLVALRLIELAYLDRCLDKVAAKTLLELWIQNYKSFLATHGHLPDNINNLRPEQEPWSSLHYQLMRGTHNFSWKPQTGVIPLDRLFVINDSKKAIYMHFASPILSEALCGEVAASQLLNVEKERSIEAAKAVFLTKEEIITQLPNLAWDKLSPFLSFAHSLGNKKKIEKFSPLLGRRLSYPIPKPQKSIKPFSQEY